MRLFTAIFLCLVLLGCSSSNVSYDYDKSVDFSALRTYRFEEPTSMGPTDPLFVNRLEDAIDADLKAKGFSRSNNGADFTVNLHRAVEKRRDLYEWGYPYGYYGFYEGYGYNRRPDIYEYQEEIIYLNLFSGDGKNLIWNSARAAVLRPTPTPEDKQTKADKVAAGLLANFPPSL